MLFSYNAHLSCKHTSILISILCLFIYSRSASDFRGFVSGIVADGGGDPAEDIMGGLNAVSTHLDWRQDAIKV